MVKTRVWLTVSLLVASPAGSAWALDDDEVERLRALGYVDAADTDNPTDRGVTLKLRGAYDGFNLVSSRHRATADLVDMNGRVVYTWRDSDRAPWMHAELQPDGGLLAIAKDEHLVRIDADSRVLWRFDTRAHHDFAVARDGRILALSRNARTVDRGDASLPVLADRLIWVSRDGRLLGDADLFALLRPFISAEQWRDLERAVESGKGFDDLTRPEYQGDLTHTNSVAFLTRAIPRIAPAGAVLLSVREINRIVILDAKLTKVLWSWGHDELQEQHDARQLPNGNIMVFDNGVHRKQSRVIELDPRAGKIVWSFTRKGLYTRLRGGAQRLPNDNILITLSDSGHCLEVTRAGKVVWEFWNPDVKKRRGRKPRRAVIYRLVRYSTGAIARRVFKEG